MFIFLDVFHERVRTPIGKLTPLKLTHLPYQSAIGILTYFARGTYVFRSLSQLTFCLDYYEVLLRKMSGTIRYLVSKNDLKFINANQTTAMEIFEQC